MSNVNEAVIRLQNFGFSFDESTVLEGINFSINAGESLFIIGPNGAGKSTLLKSLLNLHEVGKPSGDIRIKDHLRQSYKQRELAKVLSYVPQAGGWIPPFTVEYFMRLSRYPQRGNEFVPSAMQGDELAIRSALELTQIEEFADRPLRTLSGGERQRAYVAAALAQEAEIMLLDEPTSFLDPKHAYDLNQVLAGLGKQETRGKKLTLLIVTHDLSKIFSGSLDKVKVLVLAKGKQIYFGDTCGLMDGAILKLAFNHEFTIFTHPRTGLPAVLSD